MNKEITTEKEVTTIDYIKHNLYKEFSGHCISSDDTFLATNKAIRFIEAYANKRVSEALEEVEKLKELTKEIFKKDIAVAYMEGFIKAQEMFVNHIIKGTNENQIIEDINTHYLKESDALAYADKIIKKSQWLNV